MANSFFNNYLLLAATTGLDWTAATIKALLVMSNSTAPADFGAVFLTDFAVFDEHNGSGYARLTLASVTATIDPVTREVVIDCADATFGATVGNGSRQILGMVIYLDGASDAARKPLIWLDSVANGPSFPYTPAGGPVNLTPGANGLFRFRGVGVPA